MIDQSSCQKSKKFVKKIYQHSMLLFGMISLCVSISGKPGTCERSNRFQCNNGKCIEKYLICNSRNDCGDSSDESMKDGAFCGRCVLNRLIERLCTFMSESYPLYVTTWLNLMAIGSVVVQMLRCLVM